MSPLKEPGYFAHDLRNRVVVRERQYCRLFEGAISKTHVWIGEASTSYLYSDVAIANIERRCPGSRYIVMIRNPSDMAYSLYCQYRFAGWEPLAEFERAWEQALVAGGARHAPPCPEPRLLDYPAICALGSQLERMTSIVPSSRIHVVVLDDLRRDARATYRAVLQFLGLKDDRRERFPVVNAARVARWPIAASLIAKAGGVWTRLGLGYSPVVSGAVRLFKETLNSKPVTARVNRETAEKLAAFFAPEVRKLEQLLGRDLSEWARGPEY